MSVLLVYFWYSNRISAYRVLVRDPDCNLREEKRVTWEVLGKGSSKILLSLNQGRRTPVLIKPNVTQRGGNPNFEDKHQLLGACGRRDGRTESVNDRQYEHDARVKVGHNSGHHGYNPAHQKHLQDVTPKTPPRCSRDVYDAGLTQALPQESVHKQGWRNSQRNGLAKTHATKSRKK